MLFRSLEIRGAGNLLGGEQSGHIAEVGFDLYVRMVSEAVQQVKDPNVEEGFEVKVELPIDAHIPHTYIPDERLRLAAYRGLAAAHTPEAVAEVIAELTDRYGPLPEPVLALIEVARLRVLLHSVGVTEAVAAGTTVRLFPVELPESRQARLSRLYPGTKILPATRTIVVPRPREAALGATSAKSDSAVVEWVATMVTNVMVES